MIYFNIPGLRNLIGNTIVYVLGWDWDINTYDSLLHAKLWIYLSFDVAVFPYPVVLEYFYAFIYNTQVLSSGSLFITMCYDKFTKIFSICNLLITK